MNDGDFFHPNLALTSYEPLGIKIGYASGCYVYDLKNRPYLDLCAGIAVSNLGHGNPNIVTAIKVQADKHLHTMVFGEVEELPQATLAKALSNVLPSHLNTVFYTTSGSEAVEGAVKLAIKVTGKRQILACVGAYHGSSFGALSLMGDDRLKKAYTPLLPNVGFIQLNDFDSLAKITIESACVVIEPIQAATGYTIINQKWIIALQQKCIETGTLLILDEVQTGFGRTGSLFALEKLNIKPDILCLAKAMGGGLPIGAFIAERELMLSLADNPPLSHINTFGGNALVCAAALAHLDELNNNPEVISSCIEKESLFRQLLQHKSIEKITGSGLLLAVHLKKITAHSFIMKLKEKGLMTIGFLFNKNAFRLTPPLIISTDEIEKASKIILQALDEF